jgi:hypothetical protein
MKTLISILLIGLMVTSVTNPGIGKSARCFDSNEKMDKTQINPQEKMGMVEKESYTCPMHANVVSDKPGKCPKCKMDLVKKEAIKDIYTCPMHADVALDKPGKCPKCKMNLVKKEIEKDVYTCPMHSEVIQDKPGKCPKCKMTLEKKEPAKKTESKTM